MTGTRPIGGAAPPEHTDDVLPPLARAGSLTVGVIDTGIVLDGRGRPPAWFGRKHLSYCPGDDADELVYPRGQRLPSEGHGTFVAGLVLRQAPTVRVRMWGVLAKARVPTSVDEATKEDDRAVAAALAALALNPQVQVVNLSFGGTVLENRKDLETLELALASFREVRDDVSIVAAAGNRGVSDPVFPAAFDGVLAVGAVDESGFQRGDIPSIASFSNRGSWVDAYASGVKVLGPLPSAGGSQWARWSGTSFASAVVAGRIAQVAIERGLNGVAAQEVVLAESTHTIEGKARWVRSVDSVPLAAPSEDIVLLDANQ